MSWFFLGAVIITTISMSILVLVIRKQIIELKRAVTSLRVVLLVFGIADFIFNIYPLVFDLTRLHNPLPSPGVRYYIVNNIIGRAVPSVLIFTMYWLASKKTN
jgi:hypothetical protein